MLSNLPTLPTLPTLTDFVWYGYSCQGEPVFSYVLGIILCIGGMISYFPQYYSIIKTKKKEPNQEINEGPNQPNQEPNEGGISEVSLLLLNIGSACLAANSFILNWQKFKCYGHCSFWLCSSNLLSMFQIMVGWIMVCPLYLIFIRYKIKHSDRRVIYDIGYISIYIVFILIMVIVGLAEKLSSGDSRLFFDISAKILGIVSAVCSSIVWIPQIIKLLQTGKQGNLSLLMFIMQTPGNAIIIIFQILYHQNWTTWFSYVIGLVEQGTIVVILLVFKWRNRNTSSQEWNDLMGGFGEFGFDEFDEFGFDEMDFDDFGDFNNFDRFDNFNE